MNEEYLCLRLYPEQHSLCLQSSCIARQGMVAAYYAMAGDEDTDAVSSDGSGDGSSFSILPFRPQFALCA